jgi:hypothetical protein
MKSAVKTRQSQPKFVKSVWALSDAKRAAEVVRTRINLGTSALNAAQWALLEEMMDRVYVDETNQVEYRVADYL